MRKRRKKKTIVTTDEKGFHRNCYGNKVPWSKREIKQAYIRAYKVVKALSWE